MRHGSSAQRQMKQKPNLSWRMGGDILYAFSSFAIVLPQRFEAENCFPIRYFHICLDAQSTVSIKALTETFSSADSTHETVADTYG